MVAINLALHVSRLWISLASVLPLVEITMTPDQGSRSPLQFDGHDDFGTLHFSKSKDLSPPIFRSPKCRYFTLNNQWSMSFLSPTAQIKSWFRISQILGVLPFDFSQAQVSETLVVRHASLLMDDYDSLVFGPNG
jgi:hypothetical protein